MSSSRAPSNTGLAIGTPCARLPASSTRSSSASRPISARCSPWYISPRKPRSSPSATPRFDLGEHLADAPAEPGRGPAEMRLEDLADIHAARHAERVQHDVDRRAVLEIRHVLARHDPRDDALVAVAAGHLVARLQFALHRDEDLDHLHHAGRQLVAALQLFDLALEARGRAPRRRRPSASSGPRYPPSSCRRGSRSAATAPA